MGYAYATMIYIDKSRHDLNSGLEITIIALNEIVFKLIQMGPKSFLKCNHSRRLQLS